MDGLFTNSSARSDFLRRLFDERCATPTNAQIAVAFLTDAAPILRLADRGSQIRVIVRLGYPTAPDALRALLNNPRVLPRYINNETFHPKLYLFNGWGAVVGSSNMTRAALTTNQEVNVVIPAEDERYDELLALFAEYWGQVAPLSSIVIDEYERIYERHREARRGISQMDEEVRGLRQTSIENVRRDLPVPDARDLFLDEYRATYQGFLNAFRTVERVYTAIGRRKVPESSVPLRIEIDSFLSWLRDQHATGESYETAPILAGNALESKTRQFIEQWHVGEYRWFDNEVVARRYPLISHAFRSEEAIAEASFDAILEALSCENSFYDRLRFFKGGHETHLKVFRESNSLDRVRRSLRYLVFGTDDHVVRMARCIFDAEFKLNEFGRSAVQELVGWVNNDNIPICNSRTLRSLRWLGYDVDLVGG